MKHLWEHDHPYYCTEGCWFATGDKVYRRHESWEAFMSYTEFATADVDLNLIWRWDWRCKESDEDWEGEDTLQIFVMHQRKARPYSHDIRIQKEDEPEVFALLHRHWLRLQENWAPFHANSGDDAAGLAELVKARRIALLRVELAALES